jgi:hypothetical protein
MALSILPISGMGVESGCEHLFIHPSLSIIHSSTHHPSILHHPSIHIRVFTPPSSISLSSIHPSSTHPSSSIHPSISLSVPPCLHHPSIQRYLTQRPGLCDHGQREIHALKWVDGDQAYDVSSSLGRSLNPEDQCPSMKITRKRERRILFHLAFNSFQALCV